MVPDGQLRSITVDNAPEVLPVNDKDSACLLTTCRTKGVNRVGPKVPGFDVMHVLTLPHQIYEVVTVETGWALF